MRVFASAAVGALFLQGAVAIWPKRGLAINDNAINPEGFRDPYNGYWPQVNWVYNWDSWTNNKQSWTEYVPMLWSDDPGHTNNWINNARYWISQGSGHLLAFNEPDNDGQARMDVGRAVDAYRRWMMPFSGQVQLGAPAVTNGGYYWISDFLNQCQGCQIDFVPVHWYDKAWNFEALENWINRISDLIGDRKIWLTEFRGEGSSEEQMQFVMKALPFLDNHPKVYRYAYFGTADHPDGRDLIVGNGPGLTSLGARYGFSPYGNGDGPWSGVPFQVYVCKDADFTGGCYGAQGKYGQCVNIWDSFNDQVSSLGGDYQADCRGYADGDCTGDSMLIPQKEQFHWVGPEWNDRFSSFRCG